MHNLVNNVLSTKKVRYTLAFKSMVFLLEFWLIPSPGLKFELVVYSEEREERPNFFSIFKTFN